MRTLEGKLLGDNVLYARIAGLSSETKPTSLAMGSEFYEVDTGDVYMFNESAKNWAKISNGGVSGYDIPTITVTFSGETMSITCDKTYEECANLVNPDSPNYMPVAVLFTTMDEQPAIGGCSGYFTNNKVYYNYVDTSDEPTVLKISYSSNGQLEPVEGN